MLRYRRVCQQHEPCNPGQCGARFLIVWIILADTILQVLGPGDFLSRTYRNASDALPIELFVAYYPSQRIADTIHSPQKGMPGAGWTVLSMDHIAISNVERQKPVTSNRLVFAKGMDRVLVLYWYQSHGRTTPSEFWA